MKASQITSQRKGSAPSAINIKRQFQWSMIQPETGEETTTETGRHSIQRALARAPPGAGKPVREHDQDRGPDAALGHPQHEAGGAELSGGLDQTAAHRAEAPKNQKKTDTPFRAPPMGEVAAGNLQNQVAPEKDSHDVARLVRFEV